jgi:hypothetical protein
MTVVSVFFLLLLDNLYRELVEKRERAKKVANRNPYDPFFLKRKCILDVFYFRQHVIHYFYHKTSSHCLFSMSNCIGKNFTGVDLYYASKIQSEDKTWAWWLNNLG